MKTHIEITKEIMEMVEDYSMAGIDGKTLEVRIKNLLLVWQTIGEVMTKEDERLEAKRISIKERIIDFHNPMEQESSKS